MEHHELPERFSETTRHLFAAYEHLWQAKDSVCDKMGHHYFDLARASLMSILSASADMDDVSFVKEVFLNLNLRPTP